MLYIYKNLMKLRIINVYTKLKSRLVAWIKCVRKVVKLSLHRYIKL